MTRLLVLLSLVALAGCDAGTGSVSLTARPTSATQSLVVGGGKGDGTALSRVRLLINEAELRGARRGCHGGGPGFGGGNPSFCAHRRHHVERGPFLVTVDADGIASGSVSEPVLLADVPAGSYRSAELELAPLGTTDSSAGRLGPMGQPPRETPVASLGAEFDDFKSSGSTVIIDGTWSGKPFTFRAAFEAEQETRGPITVAAGGSVSLGLTIDASGWFVDAKGAALDPTVEANHPAIAANITRSLTIEDENEPHGPR
jgi:hypothetical protein